MIAPAWAACCIIAGMQVLVVAGIVAYFWARDRWGRFECSHLRLIPVAINAGAGAAEMFTPARERSTAVLWRCDLCPHVETTYLDGAWTLAQVRAWGAGQPPEDWQPPAEPLALTAGSSS